MEIEFTHNEPYEAPKMEEIALYYTSGVMFDELGSGSSF